MRESEHIYSTSPIKKDWLKGVIRLRIFQNVLPSHPSKHLPFFYCHCLHVCQLRIEDTTCNHVLKRILQIFFMIVMKFIPVLLLLYAGRILRLQVVSMPTSLNRMISFYFAVSSIIINSISLGV